MKISLKLTMSRRYLRLVPESRGALLKAARHTGVGRDEVLGFQPQKPCGPAFALVGREHRLTLSLRNLIVSSS